MHKKIFLFFLNPKTMFVFVFLFIYFYFFMKLTRNNSKFILNKLFLNRKSQNITLTKRLFDLYQHCSILQNILRSNKTNVPDSE